MTLIKVYNTTGHIYDIIKNKPEVAYYGHSFINKKVYKKRFLDVI